VLSTNQRFASKEIREQLREEWQRLQAGSRNADATAILGQGLKWQALGLSMVDRQFIESPNFQLRDVARTFDVPAYKLAIEGENEGPAMVQMGQQYLNGRIRGYCERWKAKGQKFLDWDYAHFLKADLLSRFTAYRQAVGGPWMAVNEAGVARAYRTLITAAICEVCSRRRTSGADFGASADRDSKTPGAGKSTRGPSEALGHGTALGMVAAIGALLEPIRPDEVGCTGGEASEARLLCQPRRPLHIRHGRGARRT